MVTGGGQRLETILAAVLRPFHEATPPGRVNDYIDIANYIGGSIYVPQVVHPRGPTGILAAPSTMHARCAGAGAQLHPS